MRPTDVSCYNFRAAMWFLLVGVLFYVVSCNLVDVDLNVDRKDWKNPLDPFSASSAGKSDLVLCKEKLASCQKTCEVLVLAYICLFDLWVSVWKFGVLAIYLCKVLLFKNKICACRWNILSS